MIRNIFVSFFLVTWIFELYTNMWCLPNTLPQGCTVYTKPLGVQIYCPFGKYAAICPAVFVTLESILWPLYAISTLFWVWPCYDETLWWGTWLWQWLMTRLHMKWLTAELQEGSQPTMLVKWDLAWLTSGEMWWKQCWSRWYPAKRALPAMLTHGR